MNIIQYARPVENSCTFTAIVTNLSNLFNIKLTPAQLKQWAEICWFDWDWSLPSKAIENVLTWWNKTYPKQKAMKKQFTMQSWLVKAKEWKMVYIWFRFTSDMAHDLISDWVMDKIPTDKTVGWHSCNLIYDDENYFIVDNYFWLRPYNLYFVQTKYISEMIAKKLLRWYCYIFYPTRMLQIK